MAAIIQPLAMVAALSGLTQTLLPMRDMQMAVTSKPTGAAPHLFAFCLQIGIFWTACFALDRDWFYYVLSAFGAIALTLKWQDARSTVMPQWLSIALWLPAGCFLVVFAFIAGKHWLGV